jgi:hypothetical protein
LSRDAPLFVVFDAASSQYAEEAFKRSKMTVLKNYRVTKVGWRAAEYLFIRGEYTFICL